MEKGIDIEKSIATRQICTAYDMPSWKNTLLNILLAFPFNLIFIAGIFFVSIPLAYGGENYILLCLPMILFGLYGLVGAYFGAKLIKVKTNLAIDEAKSALISFYKNRGDLITYNGKRILKVKEFSGADFNGQNYYEYTFIFDNDAVYYTLHKKGSRADGPALFTRLFTKYELNKFYSSYTG